MHALNAIRYVNQKLHFRFARVMRSLTSWRPFYRRIKSRNTCCFSVRVPVSTSSQKL